MYPRLVHWHFIVALERSREYDGRLGRFVHRRPHVLLTWKTKTALADSRATLFAHGAIGSLSAQVDGATTGWMQVYTWWTLVAWQGSQVMREGTVDGGHITGFVSKPRAMRLFRRMDIHSRSYRATASSSTGVRDHFQFFSAQFRHQHSVSPTLFIVLTPQSRVAPRSRAASLCVSHTYYVDALPPLLTLQLLQGVSSAATCTQPTGATCYTLRCMRKTRRVVAGW